MAATAALWAAIAALGAYYPRVGRGLGLTISVPMGLIVFMLLAGGPLPVKLAAATVAAAGLVRLVAVLAQHPLPGMVKLKVPSFKVPAFKVPAFKVPKLVNIKERTSHLVNKMTDKIGAYRAKRAEKKAATLAAVK